MANGPNIFQMLLVPNSRLLTAVVADGKSAAADAVAMVAARDGVRVLRRALPGRDVPSGDASTHPLLPVQHHLSVSVAERARRGRVLAAGRVRREGDARHHRSARVLRVPAACRRQHASHLRVRSAHRSVRLPRVPGILV